MNLEHINNSSLYIGRAVSLNKENWTIKFTCDALNKDAEFEAIPLFNHTYEILEGDQLLIIKPSGTFADTFYYHPITLRKFIGLKHKDAYIDMTDPDRIYITAPIALVLKAGSGFINVTNNAVTIQANVDVLGNLGMKDAYTGTILDKTGVSHFVKNGIVMS